MVSYTSNDHYRAFSSTDCIVWNNWVDEGTTATVLNDHYIYHRWITTSNTYTITSKPEIIWRVWKNNHDFSETVEVSERINGNTYVWVSWTLTQEQLQNGNSQQIHRDIYHRAMDERERRSQELVDQMRQEQEQQRREYEQAQLRVKEREQKLIESEKVAKLLLEELIGKNEMQKYENTGKLVVMGKSGTFILNKDGYHQLIKHKGSKTAQHLCIHLANRQLYPKTDNIIGLATFLKADEEGFIKMANKHGNWPIPPSLQLEECATMQ